jgi:hypothetical protein
VTLLIAVPSFGVYGGPIAHIVYNLIWLIAVRAAFAEGMRQGPSEQDRTALSEELPSRSA